MGASMNITLKELENDIVLLDVDGEIDLYTASDLKDMIFEQIDFNKTNIIIDLERVTYIDSSGIGTLITSLSKLKKINGNMCIIHVYDSVKKVFELTKLTTFFKIYNSAEEAVKFLSSN